MIFTSLEARDLVLIQESNNEAITRILLREILVEMTDFDLSERKSQFISMMFHNHLNENIFFFTSKDIVNVEEITIKSVCSEVFLISCS